MPAHQDLEIEHRNSGDIPIKLTGVNKTIFQLGGWEAQLVVKKKDTDVDADAVITLRTEGLPGGDEDQIEVTNPLKGELLVKFRASHTTITPGCYLYELEILKLTEDKRRTILQGQFTVNPTRIKGDPT